MAGDVIDRLLSGTYTDPDGSGALSVSTRSVIIANSLAGMEQEAIVHLDLGTRLAVVSDPQTRSALGDRIERSLQGVAALDRIVLPERPHADAATVERIIEATALADALIAVGSGTINDLCKFASAKAGKRYAVFGTAPSMNGYTSVNAAITVAGHKKSLLAQAPSGVFLDLDVLANAPPRMIRSGLGDSLCRPTAQADWLLAHLLRNEAYREAPFQLLSEDEEGLFAESEALLNGDLDAMERLARTLVLSGFGMSICGGSFPASQGEHLISHYADMMGEPSWPETFHGEQIGVTTLTMARLQEQLLASKAPRVSTPGPGKTDLTRHFGNELGHSCWQEFSAKQPSLDEVEHLNGRLEEEWPAICERIAAVTVPSEKLADVLKRAGASTTPEEVHWPASFYGFAVRHAREIRGRYTFLDLAADSGYLERFVASIVSSMSPERVQHG